MREKTYKIQQMMIIKLLKIAKKVSESKGTMTNKILF